MGYTVAASKKLKRKKKENYRIWEEKSLRAFDPGLGLGWKDQASFLYIQLKEVSNTHTRPFHVIFSMKVCVMMQST